MTGREGGWVLQYLSLGYLLRVTITLPFKPSMHTLCNADKKSKPSPTRDLTFSQQWSLLGRDTVSTGKQLPKLWRDVVPKNSSTLNMNAVGCFESPVTYLPLDMTKYPRKLVSADQFLCCRPTKAWNLAKNFWWQIKAKREQTLCQEGPRRALHDVSCLSSVLARGVQPDFRFSGRYQDDGHLVCDSVYCFIYRY